MLKYTIRRIGQLVVVLFILSLLLFLWLRSLPGGLASSICGERCTAAKVAELRAVLGLDDPILVQYTKFLGRVFEGNFGTSAKVIPGTPALDVFLQRFPATMELSILALALALVLSIPLGYIAAQRRNGLLRQHRDHRLTGRHRRPGLLPGVPAQVRLRREAGLVAAVRPAGPGIERHPGDRLLRPGRGDHPGMGRRLGLRAAPDPAVDRAGHHPVRGDLPDHPRRRCSRCRARTSSAPRRPKGLTGTTIRNRHMLRNALLPVITVTGLLTGALLAGAVLTETVFAYPGLVRR